MIGRYEVHLPLIDGAVAAVRRLAGSFRLAVASSSNRPLIDAVLLKSGLAPLFEVTVSSEEVARGKPAPDVYLEAARRLELAPRRCTAIEDSSNGIRSAHAAGMRVVVVPNRSYPPAADALALADVVVGSLQELSETVVPAICPLERTVPRFDPASSRSHEAGPRPRSTHALCPPRPIAFESATSTCT